VILKNQVTKIYKSNRWLLLFFILFAVGSCKSRSSQNSSLHSDKVSVLEAKELQRLNGNLNLAQVTNFQEPEVWSRYQKAGFGFLNQKSYSEWWNNYKIFAKNEGQATLIAKIQVTLNFSTTEYTGDFPMPTSDLIKTCPSETLKASKTLSYQLRVYEQPDLVRNFLILAKLGVLDKSLVQIPFSHTFMPFFGPSDQGLGGVPFFIRPNFADIESLKAYEKPQVQPTIKKTVEDTDSLYQNMKVDQSINFKYQLALVGVSQNMSAHYRGNEVVGTLAGLIRFESISQIEREGLQTSQKYPFLIGHLLLQERGSQLSVNDLKDVGIGDAYKLYMNCVSIDSFDYQTHKTGGQ